MDSKDERLKELVTARAEVWRSNGELFGFPQCCIDEFCSSHERRRVYKDGKMNMSGFIPCAEHAEQINKGEITLTSLIDYAKRLPEFGKFEECWGHYDEPKQSPSKSYKSMLELGNEIKTPVYRSGLFTLDGETNASSYAVQAKRAWEVITPFKELKFVLVSYCGHKGPDGKHPVFFAVVDTVMGAAITALSYRKKDTALQGANERLAEINRSKNPNRGILDHTFGKWDPIFMEPLILEALNRSTPMDKLQILKLDFCGQPYGTVPKFSDEVVSKAKELLRELDSMDNARQAASIFVSDLLSFRLKPYLTLRQAQEVAQFWKDVISYLDSIS